MQSRRRKNVSISQLLSVFSVTLCLSVLCDTALAQDTPPRELTDLAVDFGEGQGKLYLADHVVTRGGKVDVVIHFHGGYRVMPDAVDALRINVAAVMVQIPGRSSVYRRPFEDPELFAHLLVVIRDALRDNGRLGVDVELGKVVIVSFSAGYGAVREIVKSPEYVERIAGILLTDSMYASYAEPADAQLAEPAHVSPYVAYAKKAMEEDAVFVVTHTYLQPGTYAGTHECADELLRQLGLERMPIEDEADGQPAPGELRMKERTDAGNFHVLGYHGVNHGAHVAHTADWLHMLPLEFLEDWE